jgi:flagellar hook-associated protein 1
MNGLSSALSNALSGLLVSASQSALVSRNVTRANDQGYSRRDVGITVNGDGTARLGNYVRSADKALQDRVLMSSSRAGGAEIKSNALDMLSSTIGDPQDNTSVAAGLSQLQQSLRDFQNNPSSQIFASAATGAARALASRLNTAAAEVASVRTEAQAGAKASVEKVNKLLADLQPVDQALRTAAAGSEARLDSLDKRDQILRDISEEIGLRVVNKADGGTALYTDSGVTLFDVVPRSLEFKSSAPLSPGTAGPVLFIDGVPVSGSNALLNIQNGKLAAQLNVRDDMSLTYEAQLDETARSLIDIFAERDQSSTPNLQPATGLFNYSGSPALPAAATLVPGLAGDIRINANFDERAGGNAMLVRDGGSNGAAYVYNSTGVSGFQQRLNDLASAFDRPFSFDPGAKLGAQGSIKSFAEASASSVGAQRTSARANQDETSAVNQRWSEALLGKTGVNLDAEMASLLSLEKSYQASAKVMTTVDQMFAVLVGIVN